MVPARNEVKMSVSQRLNPKQTLNKIQAHFLRVRDTIYHGDMMWERCASSRKSQNTENARK